MAKPVESRAIRAIVALVLVVLVPVSLALVWLFDFVGNIGGRKQ